MYRSYGKLVKEVNAERIKKNKVFGQYAILTVELEKTDRLHFRRGGS